MAKVYLAKRPEKATLRHKRTRTRMKNLMSPLMDKHIALRRKVTGTWSSTNKPDFKKLVEESPGKIKFSIELIAPNAKSANISVYRMLNEGTKIRYAVMSSDFQRKTSPRVIDSVPGKGGMVNLDLTQINDGIEKREWDEEINEKLESRFKKIIEEAYRVK
jgi:hypothetical protein